MSIPPRGKSVLLPGGINTGNQAVTDSQVQQALENERVARERRWEAVQKRYDAAIAKLALLESEPEKPPIYDRVYPVDIALPLYANTSVEGTLNIDRDTVFLALGLETAYIVNGVLVEDGTTPASILVPESLRPLVLEYTFQIRDSGDDRDWSNLPVPSEVIRTGNIGFMDIGGQSVLPGGTRVTFTINITSFTVVSATINTLGLSSLDSQSLQFVLSGVSVSADFYARYLAGVTP